MNEITSADDRQVGGNHYKNGGYDHWNLALVVPYSYLEVCSTKYLARWRKKGSPITDLQKSLHYLQKLIEDGKPLSRNLTPPELRTEVARFGTANGLGDMERRFCLILGWWVKREELSEAQEILLKLLDDAEALAEKPHPVPLSDSNKHAERADKTGW